MRVRGRSELRGWKGLTLIAASVLALWLVLSPSFSISSAHQGEITFGITGSPVPTGIAVTPSRFLVARCAGTSIELLSLSADSAGFATPTSFASISGGCVDPDVALAPITPNFSAGTNDFPTLNAAGFQNNYAYVTQRTPSGGLLIREVSETGFVTPTPFATIAGCPAPYTGDIVFSQVSPPAGTGFGPHGTMLVVCANGMVFKVIKVASSGVVSTVATANVSPIEGGGVAPLTFGVCPGCLFVGASGADFVYSISPSGQVKKVARWPAANDVDFVPGFKCGFQNSSYTYFSILSPSSITKWPIAAFSGKSNTAALVTRSFGAIGQDGIGLLTAARGGSITNFEPFDGGRPASQFVDCNGSTLVNIDVDPSSDLNIINLDSGGLVVVVIFGSAVVDVNTINQSPTVLTFGYTGNEQSLDHCAQGRKDDNGDGYADLECHFRIALLGVPTPHPAQPINWILRGTYGGPSSDPPFEGGD